MADEELLSAVRRGVVGEVAALLDRGERLRRLQDNGEELSAGAAGFAAAAWQLKSASGRRP